LIVIDNIAISAPEETDDYDENTMFAGTAYDYLYRYFHGDIAQVQAMLPKLEKYYQVKRDDILNEWMNQYGILHFLIEKT